MTRLHTTAAALAGPRPGHVGLRAQPQPADPAGAVADDARSASTPICGARRSTPCRSRRCSRPTPNSGVIITDWYANPKAPGERVKLTVAILDQDLRADALRVAASRQVNQNGAWVDAPVAAATVQKLEDIILTRARDLRRTAVRGIRRLRHDRPLRPGRGRPPLAGAVGGSSAASPPTARAPSPRPMCWRCSPIRRGASTWAMSATTRWATCSPASAGCRATKCFTRWAGTRSACRPRMRRWSARSIPANGPGPISRRCATS